MHVDGASRFPERSEVEDGHVTLRLSLREPAGSRASSNHGGRHLALYAAGTGQYRVGSTEAGVADRHLGT